MCFAPSCRKRLTGTVRLYAGCKPRCGATDEARSSTRPGSPPAAPRRNSRIVGHTCARTRAADTSQSPMAACGPDLGLSFSTTQLAWGASAHGAREGDEPSLSLCTIALTRSLSRLRRGSLRLRGAGDVRDMISACGQSHRRSKPCFNDRDAQGKPHRLITTRNANISWCATLRLAARRTSPGLTACRSLLRSAADCS